MEQHPSWEANSCTVSQEITHLLWNLKVHTMFARTRHWSLSWTRWSQFTSLHSVSLRSILKLSPHVHLGIPSGHVFFRFPTKVLNMFFVTPMHAIPYEEYKLWNSSSNFFPTFCYFLPLRFKYSSQYPVQKHPHLCCTLNIRDEVSVP
jgi:hypothetical protein